MAHEGFDFLIKWNPRQEDPKTWLTRLEQGDLAQNTRTIGWQTPREGKCVATFKQLIGERRMQTSLRLSGLPSGYTLANFDFSFHPFVSRASDQSALRSNRSSQVSNKRSRCYR